MPLLHLMAIFLLYTQRTSHSNPMIHLCELMLMFIFGFILTDQRIYGLYRTLTKHIHGYKHSDQPGPGQTWPGRYLDLLCLRATSRLTNKSRSAFMHTSQVTTGYVPTLSTLANLTQTSLSSHSPNRLANDMKLTETLSLDCTLYNEISFSHTTNVFEIQHTNKLSSQQPALLKVINIT